MKNTEQKIPALRFPEFKTAGEWESVSLENLGKLINGLTYSPNDIRDTGLLVLRSSNIQGGQIVFEDCVYVDSNIKGANITNPNDILICVRNGSKSLIGKNAIIPKNIPFATHGAFMTTLRSDSAKFVFQLLQTRSFFKQVQSNLGATINSINTSNLLKYKFLIPSLPEQQKIADFLSAVDTRLQLLKDKKTKIEEYKRGVMQRIFSQELRFTRPDGSAYPDWEEKKLGEIGTTYNGLSGKTAEDFGLGKPYIQYKQIFDNSKIDINKCGFVNIVNGEKQNEVVYGDILFTTSSETPHEVGSSSVILDEVKNTYLNSFCFGFRPNSLTELYPSFSRYLFRSETVRKDIITLAQGSTRYNMSKIEFLKIGTFIPHLDEQRQIADFLSAIDDKISLLSNQIQSTEQYKKGLLQQMFV